MWQPPCLGLTTVNLSGEARWWLGFFFGRWVTTVSALPASESVLLKHAPPLSVDVVAPALSAESTRQAIVRRPCLAFRFQEIMSEGKRLIVYRAARPRRWWVSSRRANIWKCFGFVFDRNRLCGSHVHWLACHGAVPLFVSLLTTAHHHIVELFIHGQSTRLLMHINVGSTSRHLSVYHDIPSEGEELHI